MRHRSLLLCVLFLLGGCLEFDSQEITLVYDAKADRIDAHFVYRGLFVESGSGSTDDPMAKALEDLAKVRDRGTFYFWCNWPFSVDLTGKLALPIQGLAAHVEVENGGLFTDASGVLCAHQFVRVREAKAFVQKLNTLLELAVQANASGPIDSHGPDHLLDEDTQDLLREFFRSGSRMLLVEPGRIELRLPCSATDHTWLRRELELTFLDSAPREMLRRTAVGKRRADGGSALDTTVDAKTITIDGPDVPEAMQKAASFRFFWDNEWSMVREQDLTRIAIGVKGAERLVVRKASEGLYHDGLLAALRQKGEAIEEKVGDEQLEQRFAQFRARDAVLPPRLATLRAPAPATTK